MPSMFDDAWGATSFVKPKRSRSRSTAGLAHHAEERFAAHPMVPLPASDWYGLKVLVAVATLGYGRWGSDRIPVGLVGSILRAREHVAQMEWIHGIPESKVGDYCAVDFGLGRGTVAVRRADLVIG